MQNINKAIIVGNVGNPPHVHTTNSKKKTVTFTVATTFKYTDDVGKKIEKTQWHRVVCWQELATICEKYVRKGSAVYVEGRLEYRTYEKDGVEHQVTEIIASTVSVLDKKPVDAPPPPAEFPHAIADEMLEEKK